MKHDAKLAHQNLQKLRWGRGNDVFSFHCSGRCQRLFHVLLCFRAICRLVFSRELATKASKWPHWRASHRVRPIRPWQMSAAHWPNLAGCCLAPGCPRQLLCTLYTAHKNRQSLSQEPLRMMASVLTHPSSHRASVGFGSQGTVGTGMDLVDVGRGAKNETF